MTTTGLNLVGGVANGTYVPLNPSAFQKTAANISDLDTLRVSRPSYTLYAGLPVSNQIARVLGTGGYVTTAAANAYLTVMPAPVYGYYTDVENTYKTDWRKTGTGIVQAQTTGPNGMKYRATTSGIYTPYIDYGDGTPVAGTPVTIS